MRQVAIVRRRSCPPWCRVSRSCGRSRRWCRLPSTRPRRRRRRRRRPRSRRRAVHVDRETVAGIRSEEIGRRAGSRRWCSRRSPRFRWWCRRWSPCRSSPRRRRGWIRRRSRAKSQGRAKKCGRPSAGRGSRGNGIEPMRARALGMGVVAIVALLAGAERAHAQEVNVAEARALFERGVTLADQELWAEAADAFRSSLAIVWRPNTLYNLGNALYRTGRHSEAIEVFEEYLRVSDTARDAARRTEAQRMLGISRRSVVTLTLRVAPATARVTVDGALVEGEGTVRRL